MSYKLITSVSTLTRPNNVTPYASGSIMSATDNSCFACAVPTSTTVNVVGFQLSFDFIVSPTPNQIKLFFFSANPVPALPNVDGTSLGATAFVPVAGIFEHSQQFNINATPNLSVVTIVPTQPLHMVCPAATVYVVMVCNTGTTPTANGKMRLELFVETPINRI